MKKIFIVGTFFIVLFVIILGLVLSVFKVISLFGSPIELKDKIDKKPFNISFYLQNKTNNTISIGLLELKPNANIEIRSLSKTLFISWNGVSKSGKLLEPSKMLKLENSAYGKYSIDIARTSWNSLVSAPISDKFCRQYAIKLLHSMPTEGLSLEVRDQDYGTIYQVGYYSETSGDETYNIELEELFRRYSSRGSNFRYRYTCQTAGGRDRLGHFIRIIEQLTK